MNGSTVFVVVIVVVVVAVGVVVALRGQRRGVQRRETFSTWAADRGWSYAEEDSVLAGQLNGAVFDRGHGHRVRNVVRGRLGDYDAEAFDFSYTTVSSGGEVDVDKVHRVSVASVVLGRQVPAVAVEPQGAGGRLLGKLTGHDIEVGQPDFDKRFKVTAADRTAVHPLFTAEVCRFAVEHPNRAWALQDQRVLTWGEGEQTPSEIAEALTFVEALARRLPRLES